MQCQFPITASDVKRLLLRPLPSPFDAVSLRKRGLRLLCVGAAQWLRLLDVRRPNESMPYRLGQQHLMQFIWSQLRHERCKRSQECHLWIPLLPYSGIVQKLVFLKHLTLDFFLTDLETVKRLEKAKGETPAPTVKSSADRHDFL